MSVDVVVTAKPRPLGNLTVARALPTLARRHVGPFVFLDHMGPAEFPPGVGFDVAPHPHIGLSTVTYLFEGRSLHRDSLGSVQTIDAGAINLMTAGAGIVHSERSLDADRANGSRMHGAQLWLGLPLADEDGPASFAHFPAEKLPTIAGDHVTVRVLMGRAFGVESPVVHPSNPWLVDVAVTSEAELAIPDDAPERAVFVIGGSIELDGETHGENELLVLTPGSTVLRASGPARLLLLGGAPLDGPRFLDWNFVASSRERIEAAKERWRAHEFPAVPGDDGYVPLPETPR